VVGRDEDRSLNVKLELEREDQFQVKTADSHPIRKSVPGDLAQCYDLADVWSNPFFLLVEERGRNKERRILAIGRACRGRELGHRQACSLHDPLDLFRTPVQRVLASCSAAGCCQIKTRSLNRYTEQTAHRYGCV
jgi:hypothetical protein